jgi:hypothetical protein
MEIGEAMARTTEQEIAGLKLEEIALMTTEIPTVKKLDTGYWHARWSSEAWAQWPINRSVREEDFFHASFTYTPERAKQCDTLTQEAA